MRSAELVGLTPNGKFLIVATDSGEQLAIAADDRLRAALRGDRPRLGQLEIEMESGLTPREIQTRIRSGEDIADVARSAGIGVERVERFAGPVLAERDHIARQAMGSSVRRRGESSAHRNLRQVVNERLQGRGVELANISWDSFRHADGRWVVTATYTSGEAERQAQFSYDPLGRFSVAHNDEGHWILGDSSTSKGPQPGRRRPAPGEGSEDDTEPTLDLSDELALVRVVQDAIDESDESDVYDESREQLEPGAGNGDAGRRSGAAFSRTPEHTVAVPPLRVVEGGWEPAIVVNYPVEPGPAEDASDEPNRHDPPTDIVDRRDEEHEFVEEHESDAEQPTAEHEPGEEQGPTAAAPDPVEAEQPIDEQPIDEQPAGADARDEPESARGTEPEVEQDVADTSRPAKPGRRKRASVPSWDEIMFGGPRK